MISTEEALLRLALAAFFGGCVGLEREIHGRDAGFRTHMLVCLGSALIMLTSLHMSFLFKGFSVDSVIRLDPARIAAMTITGIGFLGAGAIIQAENYVRGLTTAACLWVVAAIGLAVGSGFYVPAGISLTMAMVCLMGLKFVEKIFKKDRYHRALIVCEDKGDPMESIRTVFDNNKMKILNIGIDKDLKEKEVSYNLNVRTKTIEVKKEIIDELMRIEGMKRLRWK